MGIYLNRGGKIWTYGDDVLDLSRSLPVGTYTVGFTDLEGYFLEKSNSFSVSDKIYGKVSRQAERILNTFNDRPNNTGVLLMGEKGSGKTMLAKVISQLAAVNGISTIIINTQYHGDAFNSFMQSINEPVILIFDEFEKVYESEAQESILTLMDGVFPSKKMFILTVNDRYKVNTHMTNRPGRLFYCIEYRGLETNFIEEYCNDNLKNKEYTPQICRLTMLFESFNFDMLKALVEEMNRYNESPREALEMLNAKPTEDGRTKHTAQVFVNGVLIKEDRMYPKFIRGNPLAIDAVEFYIEESDDNKKDSFNVLVQQKHITKVDADSGIFTFTTNDGNNTINVVLTRDEQKYPEYNWMNAF